MGEKVGKLKPKREVTIEKAAEISGRAIFRHKVKEGDLEILVRRGLIPDVHPGVITVVDNETGEEKKKLCLTGRPGEEYYTYPLDDLY